MSNEYYVFVVKSDEWEDCDKRANSESNIKYVSYIQDTAYAMAVKLQLLECKQHLDDGDYCKELCPENKNCLMCLFYRTAKNIQLLYQKGTPAKTIFESTDFEVFFGEPEFTMKPSGIIISVETLVIKEGDDVVDLSATFEELERNNHERRGKKVRINDYFQPQTQ